MKYVYRVDWKAGGHCLLKVTGWAHMEELIKTYAMAGQFKKITLLRKVKN